MGAVARPFGNTRAKAFFGIDIPEASTDCIPVLSRERAREHHRWSEMVNVALLLDGRLQLASSSTDTRK